MPFVIPSRSDRLTQPGGRVEIADRWGSRSPVLLATAAGGFVNVVNGKPPTLGSTVRFLPSMVGMGANGSASSTTSSVQFEDYAFGGTTPITVVAFSDERPVANQSFVGQDTEVILRVSAAGTGVEFILNSFATNDRVTAVANGRAGPGFFAAGSYGPSGKLRAYANTAMAEVTPTGTYANATGLFSAIYTAGLNQLFGKKLALVAIFRAELSQAELRDLCNNPWQLFKPASRAIALDVVAGAGGGASASGALASLAIVAALGAAVGGAAVSGALLPVALSAAAGSATGGAAATGAPASISLTPAAGAATGSGGGAAAASGTPSPLALQPAAGSATGGAASAGAPSSITLSPAMGTATGSAGGGAAASGAPAALVVFPPAGTAIGGAVAGGSLASISITPAAGAAYDGSVPSINWPAGRLDAAHRSDVPAAHVRLLVRERSVRVAVPSRAVRALVFPEQST